MTTPRHGRRPLAGPESAARRPRSFDGWTGGLPPLSSPKMKPQRAERFGPCGSISPSGLCCALSLISLGIGAGCGVAAPGGTGFQPGVLPTEEPLVTLSSDTAAWRLSLWTSPFPPRKGAVDVMYHIVDVVGEPADDLVVQVIPWMPAHGHGTSAEAVVIPQGDGLYLVRPVYLYMSGRWELRTGIKGLFNDSAVPTLDIP